MVNNLNEYKKIQKNRFHLKPKKKTKKLNRFGDYCIVSKNEGRLELLHITIFKKKLKMFIKKKKSEIDIIREKIWYFGRPNFYIQKKSKNSRMGKGKGLIERKVIRFKQNSVLFELKGVPVIKIKRLVKFINKLTSIKFYVYGNKEKFFTAWSKLNKYIIYHEKYLYQ